MKRSCLLPLLICWVFLPVTDTWAEPESDPAAGERSISVPLCTGTTNTVYDEKGRIESATRYDEYGEVLLKFSNEYDQGGKLVESTLRDGTGQTLLKDSVKYNDNRKVTEVETRDAYGGVVHRQNRTHSTEPTIRATKGQTREIRSYPPPSYGTRRMDETDE